MAIQREFSVKKRAADDFIDCIVAADVFAHDQRFAIEIEYSGGVNSAGAGEVGLLFSKERRKREQCIDVDPQ